MSTTRDIPTILNHKEVDEELIRAAATLMPNTSSSFHTALAIGKEYKDAGLTPMYIIDQDERNIYVTTAEKMANGLQ